MKASKDYLEAVPPEALSADDIVNGSGGLRTGAGRPFRRNAAIGFSLLLAAIYAKPLMDLMIYAAGNSLHSHVVLIPFIAAYLIMIQKSRLPAAGRPAFGLAAVPLLIGLAFLIGGWSPITVALSENDRLAIFACSFVCLVWTGGLIFLGREWMASVAFPMAFLLFLVPLPDAAADWLETASKFASADAADLFFGLAGVPNLRDGLVFRLPGIVIEVAQECSGIRSSWVLFITSLLASHLFLRTSWRRAFLVAVVIPLGVLRNGFRIVVIGFLCVQYGPEMIHSIIHRRGGPVFFVLSLIPLFLLLACLRSSELRSARAKRPVLQSASASQGD